MSFARLRCRLGFLPLGLLWGVVGGGFHTYLLVHLTDDLPHAFGPGVIGILILVSTVMILVTSPIVALLARAMLKPELSSIGWSANWVITAFASTAGGVVVFWLMLLVLFAMWAAVMQPNLLFSNFTPIVEHLAIGSFALLFVSTGFGIVIGIVCALVALVLAPLSLLGRRLILHRASAAKPTGGASK